MADWFQLSDVIALNESSGNAQAVKFEFGTFSRIRDGGLNWTRNAVRKIADLHDCDEITAQAMASTSWGRYQIMGFNLWDATTCGIACRIGEFLCNAQTQDDALFAFLKQSGIGDITVSDLENDETKREVFITKYNGPGDIPGYWALTLRSIAYLRAHRP